MLTPKQLLRLYPGIWRLKYGPEFLAMLEAGEPSWQRTWDVARSAAWEWLRWTNVGRNVMALLVGAAATLTLWTTQWLGLSWNLLDGIRLTGWGSFSLVAVIHSIPLLVATSLVYFARPATKGGGLRFGTQLGVLFFCLLLEVFLPPRELPTWTLGAFVKGSVGAGLFVAFFLWLIFNIERVGRWRRPLSGDLA